MKTSINSLKIIILVLLGFIFQSLVVRHDVDDGRLLQLAKQFPQVCHFANGEGTLIAPEWVLTAAHVGELYIKETDTKKLTVKCNGQDYLIDKVFLHADYVGEGEKGVLNDVALVKLKKSVVGIKPAKLYNAKDEKGKKIYLVGAGIGGTGLTGPLKEKWDHKTRAATNRIDDVEGNFVYFKFDHPDSKAATELEGISGPGDSGGPAFVKMNGEVYIIGISSHQKIYTEIDDNGKATGGEGFYGVVEFYSRVSDYGSWIKHTMAN